MKVDDGGPIHLRTARRPGWSVLTFVGLLAVGLMMSLQKGRTPEDSGPTPDEIARAVQLAQTSIEARNAFDAEALIAIVADEGLNVVLMHDNLTSTAMPDLFLSKRQTGFALEAERIYGVKYNNANCGHPEGPPNTATAIFVRCVYELDSKMRRFAHLPPLKSSFDIIVEDEHIVSL